MENKLEYLKNQCKGDASDRARKSASAAIMEAVIGQTFARTNPVIIAEELARHYCRAFTSICYSNGLSESDTSSLLNDVYLKAKGVALEEIEHSKEEKDRISPEGVLALAALLVAIGGK